MSLLRPSHPPILAQRASKGFLGAQPCVVFPRTAHSRPLEASARSSASTLGHRRVRRHWASKRSRKQQEQLQYLDDTSNEILERLLDSSFDSVDESPDASRIRTNELASTSNAMKSDLARHTTTQTPFGGVAPSPEVLVAALRRVQEKRSLLRDLDINSPAAVARCILLQSAQLDMAPGQVAAMTRACGRLLCRRPDELRDALEALTDCMAGLIAPSSAASASSSPMAGGRAERRTEGSRSTSTAGSRLPVPGVADAAATWRRAGNGSMAGEEVEGPAKAEALEEAVELAKQMVFAVPELLLGVPERLRLSGRELGAVCKARGIQVVPLLSRRPDLLLQSAASLAAKMDVLPGVLGLPPRKMRDILAAYPDLLRRSPKQLANRYQLLQRLFDVPPAFMTELLLQEPRMLCFGIDTLRAKFEGLTARTGMFADDVADMILVDPAVFLNAEPSSAATALSPKQTSTAGLPGSKSGAAAPSAVPVLDTLMALSAATGVPIDSILSLVAQDERISDLAPEEVSGRLSALSTALAVAGRVPSEEEVRAKVANHPRLLLLQPDDILSRQQAVVQMLRPSTAAGGGAAGQGSAAGFSSEAVAAAVLSQHPELLLQDPAKLRSRLADLVTLLVGGQPGASPTVITLAAKAEAEPAGADAGAGATRPPVPRRVLSLLQLQPGLLATAPGEMANKLLVMQSMFEIPRALVLELVFKEPGLLAVSVDDLERKFRALASSFGAFSSDAIDVVLADPSLVLRADQRQLQSEPAAGAPEAEPAGGPTAGAATAASVAAGIAEGRSRGRGRRRETGANSISGGTTTTSGSRTGSRQIGRVQEADREVRSDSSRRRSDQRQRDPPASRTTAAGAAAPPTPLPLVRLGQRGLTQQQWQAGLDSGAGWASGRQSAVAEVGQEDAQATAAGAVAPTVDLAIGAIGGVGENASADRTAGGSEGRSARKDTGALGAMSAAEFDALGSLDGRSARGPGSRESFGASGAGGPKADMGRLGEMSAADFDALGSQDGSLDGDRGSAGAGGKMDMGRLATMSAAEFDRLGEEGLPPPPPPRRRRRQQQ